MTYKDCVKSNDTDGLIDRCFLLPVAFFFTKIFNKLHFTPNMVSVLSGIFGVAGGVCFFFDSLVINLVGVVLILLSAIFDDSDGQLARMTKHYSPLGRIVDGACDTIVMIAIYLGLLFRLIGTNVPYTDIKLEWWLILVVELFAGYCHSDQCRMADYFRNLHLFFLNGKEGCELDRSKNLEKHNFYYVYTKIQEIRTPNTNKLLNKIEEQGMNEDLKNEFLKYSKKDVYFTKLLTFNFRTLVMLILVPLNLGFYFFCFVIVIMSILLIIMVRLYEGHCKRLLKKYFGESK